MVDPYYPDDIEAPLFIEAGDVTIDAVGTYDALWGDLRAVDFNGRTWGVEAFRATIDSLCPGTRHLWARRLDADDLIAAQRAAHASNAERQRDFRAA